jgi:2'-5' RNA ligase
MLKATNDNRYGLTLLSRPSEKVIQNISEALEQIKAIEPNQYYYPGTDLHVTMLSIISCYPNFSLDNINPKEYCKVIDSAVASVTPFRITFRGITASPSCILIQGFPEDNQLKILRDTLRDRFEQSDLQHSIDKRYQLQTADMTAIRLKEPIAEAGPFIKVLSNLRDQYFGSCVIKQLELVGNDWYQQEDKVQSIRQFNLSD